MTTSRLDRLILSTLAAVLLAGCGGAPSPTGSVECVEPVDGVLTITAADRRFDVVCMALPAGEAVTIRLVNEDLEPHNVALYTDSSTGTELFMGELIDGGETVDYEIEPLEAGTHYFDCTVHPDMNGSVIAQ
ncbi:MAG TPA: cupredoxin domain-containing protein [Candidatus Limnocylindria bacterium]|jgi:plastocyanin